MKILSHARWVANHRSILPLDYLLIDDGWTTLGDWLILDERKFPGGMKRVVAEIKLFGLKAGLWIAPFLASAYSRLARLHPDWFIKDRKGKLIDGGKITNFDRFFLPNRWILDFRLDPVREYLKRVIEILVNEWGIELLKLDFLYAQHFNPEYDRAYPPDTLLRNFLIWIRKSFPNIYTIGCGCPLAPAAGLVDAMRISEDLVSPHLINLPVINSFVHKKRIKQLELNLLSRSVLKNIWRLDPDAFVCDPAFGLGAEATEKLKSLIGESGGHLFLGDNLIKLAPTLVHRYLVPLFEYRKKQKFALIKET